ncbi:PEP-CTERM sorting domain-containing protein [Pseudoduganella buxea]|uniref:PEP-CTERM sorting domain-containing protein n=1 Tax=Pseudoduganella buxea TaxID=1949069 RepID=A0A6I3T0S7_9BURK|nr:PEP-CTERM sorting domain-containing protein [Pseudoduganella buxea]MTV54949.1 PEP-CTERM sorting domain-containing protein [Pseudoduganella buxea]GGC17271.1 hypothetical protein GCM10011572_43240 [Pseudoduganella buxea]
MLKQLACAVFLAVSAAGVSAQTHWDFMYTGFEHQETGIFDPTLQIQGSFDGVDADLDGILEHNEVTSFTLDTLEYVDNPDGCRINSCSLLSFSYGTHSGKLNFESSSYYADDFNYSYSSVIAGVRSAHQGANGSGESFTTTLVWTDQTKFWIYPVATPVPEPSTMAMLGAGLLAVGLVRRRERSKA